MKRLCILAPLVAAALLAVASPASARTNKAIWGPVTLSNGQSAFPIYRGLGVRNFEIQLQWNRIAPTRPADAKNPNDPAYRWSPNIDRAVAMGQQYGIGVALLVKGSPPWANGGRDTRWAPNSDADYARFLVAASRRYPSVRRWMIWGEANRAAVFQPLPPGGRTGPRRYARLLDSAFSALKRRNRRNRVVGGMTFSFGEVQPARFVRFMRLRNGRPPRLDEFGHNPFSRRIPNLRLRGYPGFPESRDFSDVDSYYKQIKRTYQKTAKRSRSRWYRRFRRSGPRLWLSEFTVSSDRPNRAFTFAVSRAEQAHWLQAGFSIARRSRWIAGLGWFNLIDEPAANGLTTGLLDRNGVAKPSYYAYRAVH